LSQIDPFQSTTAAKGGSKTQGVQNFIHNLR